MRPAVLLEARLPAVSAPQGREGQQKAEAVAKTATAKCEEAEREALRTRGELEELQKRFEIVKAEADTLNELNARIERAKHAGDLFSS